MTTRHRYDSQPYLPDPRAVYFSAIRPKKPKAHPTSINQGCSTLSKYAVAAKGSRDFWSTQK